MVPDFILIIGFFSIILILTHIFLSRKRENFYSLLLSVIIFSISLYLASLNMCGCWFLLEIFLFVLIFVISIATLLLVKILEMHLFTNHNNEHEFVRKAFHLVALILFVPKQQLYGFLSEILAVLYRSLGAEESYNILMGFSSDIFLSQLLSIVAIVALFVFLIIEVVRIHTRKIDYPRIIAREKEKYTFAAEFYTAIAVFAIAPIGNWGIISAALSSALLGDSAAALIGKYFGRTKLHGDRSLEGTLTEFIVAFICSSFFVGFVPSIFVATFIILTDIFITTFIQDNLLFPIVGVLAIYVSYLVI